MDDKTKIEACIQLYFDSLYESDTDKVRASFHDAAMVSGYLPDGLHEMNLSEFADFVGSQQPSPKENNDEVLLEIVSCDINGSTASAKVRQVTSRLCLLRQCYQPELFPEFGEEHQSKTT